MKSITQEQAEKLRTLRKPAYALGKALRGLIGEVVRVRCPHEDDGIEHEPKICRYCRVFSACTSALDGIDNLTRAIDTALTEGPEPKGERHANLPCGEILPSP